MQIGNKIFRTGRVRPDLADGLREAILAAPTFSVSRDAPKKSVKYVSAPYEEVEILNKQNVYHSETEETRARADDVMHAMSGDIVDALGCEFVILHCRSWETMPEATVGPMAWHFDGQDKELLKVMVYSTDTLKNGGGLQVRVSQYETLVISGPPGLWALFENSAIEHRGIPPIVGKPNRVATEFTIRRRP